MKKLESHEVIASRIKPNSDLLLTLNDIIVANKIQTGTIQIIGALEKTDVGIYVDGKYEHIVHNGPVEIVSGLGNISLKEGKPFVHCHLMLSDNHGKSFGGHLFEGCIVHPTAEVFITKLAPEIERKFNKDLNLWMLDL